MSDKPSPRQDLYQEITDKIISALESGTRPWQKPWDASKANPTGPFNGATGHQYRGINTLLLGMNTLSFETGDPRWLTFKQAQEKGWNVKKGSKASTVIFFKKVEVNDPDQPADENGQRRTVPVLRSYPVFHASQIDGIPKYAPPKIEDVPWRKPESAELILKASGVQIREGGDRAFSSPSTDHIQLPPLASFNGPEEWAGTALHELGHATGHQSRLDRDLKNRFGSHAYAQEELRAELASVFMSWELGIPGPIDQNASYLESWLTVLKKDKKAIFSASADAQRISDWCLERHPDYKAVHAPTETTDNQTSTTFSAPSPTSSNGDVEAVVEETMSNISVLAAAVATKFGPMPNHIAKLVKPHQPETPAPAFVPTPAPEETNTCGLRM